MTEISELDNYPDVPQDQPGLPYLQYSGTLPYEQKDFRSVAAPYDDVSDGVNRWEVFTHTEKNIVTLPLCTRIVRRLGLDVLLGFTPPEIAAKRKKVAAYLKERNAYLQKVFR